MKLKGHEETKGLSVIVGASLFRLVESCLRKLGRIFSIQYSEYTKEAKKDISMKRGH